MTTARNDLPEADHAVPAVGIRLDRPVRPLRWLWVVEACDEQWRTTEWVGATRECAREQAKEWRDETSIPVRVTKYVPAA